MYSLESSISVTTVDGDNFEIEDKLWQQNKQQESILVRYFALPLREDETHLWLGVDDLTNLGACEMFSFLTGKLVEPILLSSQHLKSLLQQLSPQPQVEEVVNFEYSNLVEDSRKEQKSDEPVILLLDQIFENALKQKASDIHLEPQRNALQIRFRVDGVLKKQPDVAQSLSSRVISRLKLLAKLDISETRLPQDGRFQFETTFSDTLDFRLSTLPTHLGEKIVLRLQQNKPVHNDFLNLGMTEEQKYIFEKALMQPQGLILVTGPTGSGKSISLYTALDWLNDQSKHIMTAEDPIEIEIDGIIQSQINPQIGLDFSRLLRTFLRQDPDIIMLGEIRDEESAVMALRAAQTGHLVLSTLHTNDAPSAISRLLQLGIKQYEIDNSLLLVLAQRLLRRCCPNCHNIRVNNNLNPPKKCQCNQGYSGRIGVYQFLQYQQGKGYVTDFASLRDSALNKVKQGITDLAEVDRVLGREVSSELVL